MKVTVRIAALVAAFAVTAVVTLAQAQPEPVYPAPPPGQPSPVYPAPAQPPPPQPYPPPGYPPPQPYPPQPGYPPQPAYGQPAYAPPPAYYGPPPSNGVGLIVAGSIFLAVGVLNLITSPVCLTLNDHDTRDTCLYASLGVGGVFTAIGLPLLIAGGVKRRHYNEWVRSRQAMVLEGLRLSFSRQSGSLMWRAEF
jgi:hypothetical protein